MEKFCELCGGYGHSRSAHVTRRTWWDRLRGALICVLLTALVVIAIQAVLLLRAVTETARVTTQTVGAIPIVLTQQLTLTRLNAVAEIDLTRADAMTAIGQGLSVADSRIGQGLSVADSRIGDSLSRVDAALAVLGGVRSDLKPTLDASAALLKDGKDSLDDLYPDVKASTESATVAVTSFARASQSSATHRNHQRRYAKTGGACRRHWQAY